jgi:hypothetical protein
MNEHLHAASSAAATLIARAAVDEGLRAKGRYVAKCYDRDGNLRWEDTVENLVVTVGKNSLLDTYFAGAAYTAAWFLGLVDGAVAPTYAAGDTMAAHAGWSENTGYSNATRPAPAWNAASGGSKATTTTSFNINANGTIAGLFMVTDSTKAGAAGTLYSAGSFTGGNRLVQNGDTLNVTWTGSV